MKIEFLKSFGRDIKKIKDENLLIRIKNKIEQIEKANSISEISNLEIIKSHTEFYRIRIGDFRIGIKYNQNTIELIRFLDRKEIYRYFP